MYGKSRASDVDRFRSLEWRASLEGLGIFSIPLREASHICFSSCLPTGWRSKNCLKKGRIRKYNNEFGYFKKSRLYQLINVDSS